VEEGSKSVTRLGGLPLAIDQAAAYIQYKKIPLERLPEFLAKYESSSLTYLPLLSSLDSCWRSCLESWLHKAKLGEDHPDTLQSMQNLAINYSEAGRRSEALQLTEQVVQLRKARPARCLASTASGNSRRHRGVVIGAQARSTARCKPMVEVRPGRGEIGRPPGEATNAGPGGRSRRGRRRRDKAVW
jgi:hypothetical protein